MSYRVKFNCCDFCGNILLIIFIKYGNYEGIRIFLKAGCDVNISNKEGCIVLYYVSYKV